MNAELEKLKKELSSVKKELANLNRKCSTLEAKIMLASTETSKFTEGTGCLNLELDMAPPKIPGLNLELNMEELHKSLGFK